MNVQCVEKGVEIFFLRSVMYSVKRSGICMLLKREISFISGVKNSKRNTICINKVVLSLHILCLFPVLKPNILSNNFFFCCKKEYSTTLWIFQYTSESYNFSDMQSILLNQWQ